MVESGAHVNVNVLVLSLEDVQQHHQPAAAIGVTDSSISVPVYRMYRSPTSRPFEVASVDDDELIGATLKTTTTNRRATKDAASVMPLDDHVYRQRGEVLVLSNDRPHKLVNTLRKANDALIQSPPVALAVVRLATAASMAASSTTTDTGTSSSSSSYVIQVMTRSGVVLSYDVSGGELRQVVVDDSVVKFSGRHVDHALLGTNKLVMALGGSQLHVLVNEHRTDIKKSYVDSRGASRLVDGPDHNAQQLSVSEDGGYLCVAYMNRVCVLQFDRRPPSNSQTTTTATAPQTTAAARLALDVCGSLLLPNTRLIVAEYVRSSQNHILLVFETWNPQAPVMVNRYYVQYARVDIDNQTITLCGERVEITLSPTNGATADTDHDVDADGDERKQQQQQQQQQQRRRRVRNVRTAVVDHADKQLAIACNDNVLMVMTIGVTTLVNQQHDENRVLVVHKCVQLDAPIERLLWHPSNAYLVVFTTTHTVRVFDRALQPLRMTASRGVCATTLHLAPIQQYPSRLMHAQWGPSLSLSSSALPSLSSSSFDADTLVMVCERGPLMLMQFRLGGGSRRGRGHGGGGGGGGGDEEVNIVRQRLAWNEYAECMGIINITTHPSTHYEYVTAICKQLWRLCEWEILGRILKHIWSRYESIDAPYHHQIRALYAAYGRSVTVMGRLDEGLVVAKKINDLPQLRVIEAWARRESLQSLSHLASSSIGPHIRFPHLSALLKHSQFSLK